MSPFGSDDPTESRAVKNYITNTNEGRIEYLESGDFHQEIFKFYKINAGTRTILNSMTVTYASQGGTVKTKWIDSYANLNFLKPTAILAAVITSTNVIYDNIGPLIILSNDSVPPSRHRLSMAKPTTTVAVQSIFCKPLWNKLNVRAQGWHLRK